MPAYELPMPRDYGPLALWEFIETGIEEVMTNPREVVAIKTYMARHMTICSAVHRFCLLPREERVGSNSRTAMTPFNARGGRFAKNGEDLYTKLKGYLNKHLVGVYEKSKSHVDEDLLSYYIREWDRYTTAAKPISDFFGYLHQNWLKYEIDYGRKDVFDVYTLHLVQWRDELFTDRNINVMAGALKLVEKQRNGRTIDQSQIKSLMDSFVTLGLDETHRSRPTLDLYRYHFERPFLKATTRYYKNESTQMVSEDNVFEYMVKVEIWLDEEKRRVEQYLHPDSITLLMRTCFIASVAAHMDLLHRRFQVLLENDRQEYLAQMYRVFAKWNRILVFLRMWFELYVKESGLTCLKKVAADGENLEPKTYVNALLEILIPNRNLVDHVFEGDSGFVLSLNNACREFFNHNEVCKTDSTRSPELLAKYTDTLLKHGKISEKADLDASFDHIMMVFKYIEDKDVFQELYFKMLPERYFRSSWPSEDAEASMISKLIDTCGFEHRHKYRNMLQEIQISKALNESYSNWQGKASDDDTNKALDSNYHVLNARVWLLTPPTTTFNPPPEIIKNNTGFQKVYSEKYSRRNLTWLWNLCKGEIQANYIETVKIPYTFMVSAYQMAILLLFNDADVVTYKEAQKATKLSAEWLDPSLDILVKAKVLLRNPKNGKSEPGTSYALNYWFESKQVKVNLNLAIISERNQKEVQQHTHKTIQQDRQLLLQSTIARIMKSHRKLKHFKLVQKTISQIESRFTPKVLDIEKAINKLVEREYLERLDGEELGYLP